MNIKNALWQSLCLALLAAGSARAALPLDGQPYDDWGLFGGGQNFAPFDLGAGQADTAADAVIGPDGAMYVAGTVQDANGIPRIGVAKFDADGVLDGSFSGDGRNTSLEANVHATGIALTADGRLLVSGYKVVNGNEHDFIVCRFNASNGVNLNFPTPVSNSCVKPVWPAGTKDQASDIVVQPDGKFVIGGTIDLDGSGPYAGFARFLADGQPDLDFGNINGSNVTLMRTGNIFERHAIRAIALAGNGKVVGVGHTRVVASSHDTGLVIRLQANGQPDQLTGQNEYTFGLIDVNEGNMSLMAVALVDEPTSADDDIVVAGSAIVAGRHNGLIAKINHTGSSLAQLDFGIHPGFTLVPINNVDLRFNAMTWQPGVGFVVGGSRPGTDGLDMVVQRFTLHGTPDFLFGDGGGFFVDFGFAGVLDILSAVAIRADGLYVAGYSLVSGGNYDYTVAKFGLDRIFADGVEGFD